MDGTRAGRFRTQHDAERPARLMIWITRRCCGLGEHVPAGGVAAPECT
jgi:hypothetical protein